MHQGAHLQQDLVYRARTTTSPATSRTTGEFDSLRAYFGRHVVQADLERAKNLPEGDADYSQPLNDLPKTRVIHCPVLWPELLSGTNNGSVFDAAIVSSVVPLLLNLLPLFPN